jgi:hypothetical protein
MSAARQVVDSLLEAKPRLPARYRRIASDTVRDIHRGYPVGRECKIVSGLFKGHTGVIVSRAKGVGELYNVRRDPRSRKDLHFIHFPACVPIEDLEIGGYRK